MTQPKYKIEESWFATKLLWKRMDELNKEWQSENPKERELIHEDTLKLIEWKIEKTRKEEQECIKKLIIEEILICYSENTPTSRLTSLINKIKNSK